jgi:hypothetical protein
MIGKLSALLVLLASPALAGQPAASPQPGGNLALHAKYTLFPAPNYSYCTDPDDKVQLTNGQSTKDYFWTQKGTVGWSGVPYATVALDLGQVQPIGGVAFTTAAGVAGVTWPLAIHVLVSDDGKTYRDAGDLVTLDLKAHGPWPEKYAIRRLATDELKARGRYVQLVAIPMAGGSFLFVDEVEVFRGPAELLTRDFSDQPTTDARTLFEQGRVRRAIAHRLQADVAALAEKIAAAPLADASLRKRLTEKLQQVSQQFAAEKIVADASFRAVLPIGPAHARLFEIQAELWRSLARPALSAWAPPTWDPVELITIPPEQAQGSLEVHTMRGEYRAAALNLANSTDRPLTVRLRFEGLPQSPRPACVTLHEVAWTDTSLGKPVAAALPEAAKIDGGWSVTVLPGLVRQVWMTFHATDLAPGNFAGTLVAETDGVARIATPVRLRVWPLDFPAKTTLWLGGWSYTNGGGSYGVTPENRQAFLEHLQSRFVNAPWASASVMMSCRVSEGNPPQVELDTQMFDDWINQWPEAQHYMVFLSQNGGFAGAKPGTPEFDARVAAWISAWVQHLGKRGIAPERLALLIHDEPHEQSDVSATIAWANAIHRAEPKVVIWEDPTYQDPRKAPPELFQASHVLCPNRPMWLQGGKPFEQFYLDQQRQGRTLQFYSCSGPAKTLDPYSYYRLQAWHCWQIGATGSYFWAFGDNSGASSWNEYFSTAGPFTPLFLDDKTVVAGKQMEAIRESVEDYEYFVMLRKAVDRAKAAGRTEDAVAKAETLLSTAAQAVVQAPEADQLNWHAPKDRTRADAERVKLLQALDLLK